MSDNIILTNLLENDEYVRKVLPFLKLSYFQARSDKLIFTTFVKYYEKYNVLPTHDAMSWEMAQVDGEDENIYQEAVETLGNLTQDKVPAMEWLVDTTEAFCQDNAIYNAVIKSMDVINGEDEKLSKHVLPELLKDALSVSFDSSVGHDYFENAQDRFEFYNLEHERIPFDLSMLNKVTNGGVPKKTLNIILAGVNVGKTLGMVHMAASYLKQGKNVLYITLEMAEEMISNRIDANLFNMAVNDVQDVAHDIFNKNINRIEASTNGRLVVKEYPTSSAHVGHFRQLIQELKLKKNFVPDVIFVDYINIMASSRVKLSQAGSYAYVKYIAEELRGLAVELNLPLWTATQVNRTGFNDTDVDITSTAESFGLPATADFMIAIIRTEELDKLGQLLVKQLKSRYGNKSYFEKFVIGVDVDKMQLFDVEDYAQDGLIQEGGEVIAFDKKTGEIRSNVDDFVF